MSMPLIIAMPCLLAASVACASAADPPNPSSHESNSPPIPRTWRTFTTADGLPHNDVQAVHVVGDRVWVGTVAGLALLHDGLWTSWTEAEGLPHPHITAIAPDSSTGDLWLGTWGGGLVRFSGGRFDSVNQLNSGLAGNLIFDLVLWSDRIWAATNAGLSVYDPLADSWELHFERRADGPETVITSLSPDQHSLYAAAWCGGAWRYDLMSKSWSRLRVGEGATTDTPAAEDTTLAVQVIDQSLWWMTQTRLLQRKSGGAWFTHSLPARQSLDNLMTCFTATGSGEVWLGTDDGLAVASDPAMHIWATSRPGSRIRCITVADDTVWIGTANGLARGTMREVEFGMRNDRRAKTHPLARDALHASPIAVEPAVINIAILRPGNRVIAIAGAPAGGDARLGSFDHPPPNMDQLVVKLAIEHANARGGYRGRIPFGVATGPEGAFQGWGWTTPEDDFPVLAAREDVWGLIAFLGPYSRIASAVALRSEMPVVNYAPAPATVDELLNPWIFRCRGERPRQQRLTLDYVFDRLGHTRVAVLRTSGRTTQMHLDRWSDHARRRGYPVQMDIELDTATGDLKSELRSLLQADVDVVLTWCGAIESARLLRALREVGVDALFVGSDSIADSDFVDLAGKEPGPVIAVWPRLTRMNRQNAAHFAKDYEQRFKRSRSRGGHLLYESVTHLLDAINAAGLDREAIRDTLRQTSRAADGERHCQRSPYGPDDIVFGLLKGGHWRLYSRAAL